MATSTTRTAAPGKSATKTAAGAKTSIPNLQVDDLVGAYVPARLPEGTVVGIWGGAIIRPAGGQPRALVVGDEVHKGDMILTSQSGIVQIRREGDALARIPEAESLENLLVAFNAGDAPPGAGLPSDGSLQPGVNLNRVYEVVSGQEYSFDAAQLGSGIALRAAADNGTPLVLSVEPGAPGSGDDGVLEGTSVPNQLVYTVTLNHASTTVVNLPVAIGNGTANSNDYGTPTFSNGVVLNADGTVTVPAGVSTFTITVPTKADGVVEPDETLPVSVGGVTGTGVIVNDDHAPVAGADSASGHKNLAQTFAFATLLANDSDPDGDALTLTSVGNATHGTVAIENGAVVFRPEAGYAGTATFDYVVTDSYGNPSTATVTVTVVNDPPVATPDSASTDENTPLTVPASTGVILGTGKDTDPNGDALTVASVGVGAGSTPLTANVGQPIAGVYGQLTLLADGSYTYTPNDKANALAQGATATDVFTYTVTDNNGAASSATTLTITVTGVNDAPTVVSGALSAQSSQDAAAFSYDTHSGFKDVDTGDTLTYSATQLPTGLTINAATGVISGTLASDASVHGPYTIAVTATDSQGAAVSQNFVLTVTNPPPVASNDTGAVNEDATLTVTAANGVITSSSLTAGRDIDPDGDALVVTAVRTGSETSTGTTGTLGSSLAGTYGHLTLKADGSYVYVADNANALKVGETQTDTFTYTVSDGQGGTDKAELVITVTGVNDAPVAANDTAGVAEDARTTGSVTANDTDVDGPVSALTVSGVRTGSETGTGTTGTLGSSLAGTYGHLTLNADGSYSYVADNANALAAGVQATDTFTYTVSDGQGGFDTAQLAITVTGTDDAPVAHTDALGTNGNGTNEDTAATGNVLANDTDVDTAHTSLTVTSFSVAGTTYTAGQTASITGVGTLLLNTDGSYTFTPAHDYNNTALTAPVVSYTVSDGSLTASSSLTLQVNPVKDTVLDEIQTTQNTAQKIDLLANDTFSDNSAHITQLNGQSVTAGDGTKVAVTYSGTQVGSVTLNADGTVTFEPVAGYTNTAGTEAHFTYTVSAGGTTETDGSVYVAVTTPMAATTASTTASVMTAMSAAASTDTTADLTATAGHDVFAWSLADPRTSSTVAGFSASSTTTANGDTLDLRDLLQGESAVNIDQFLQVTTTGNTSTLHISSTGGFTAGASTSAVEDHTITLTDNNLAISLGLAGSSSAALVAALLKQGNVVIDNG